MYALDGGIDGTDITRRKRDGQGLLVGRRGHPQPTLNVGGIEAAIIHTSCTDDDPKGSGLITVEAVL